MSFVHLPVNWIFKIIFDISIDLVTNKGTSIRTQTFVVSEKEKKQVEALEKEIISKLQGKSDIEICALLSVLNSKLNQ